MSLGFILFTLFGTIHARTVCEDAKNETFCMHLKHFTKQSCYWNATTADCISFQCGHLSTESTCSEHSDDYFCEWSVFHDTQLGALQNPSTGDLEVCFTQCPTNIDIVFIIDLSRSVIDGDGKANNPSIIGDFIETVMDTWWKITQQLNKSTSFGLVTFATDEHTQFDLNTGWNLTQYLDRIDGFFVRDKFRGQTNTIGGLDEALAVFNSSQHYVESDWERLAILVTDGEPTIGPLWARHGSNPCHPEYDMDGRYMDMNVFLWAGLIGDIPSHFLTCFNPSRSAIRLVNDYESLGAEISGIVGHVECKITASPTEEPTDIPTEDPTFDPTQNPTNLPSAAPTFDPTREPTEHPTQNPTSVPTQNPTANPTITAISSEIPTNDPTEMPVLIATELPTEHPTEVPTSEPTLPPIYDACPLDFEADIVFIVDSGCGLTTAQCYLQNQFISDMTQKIKLDANPRFHLIDCNGNGPHQLNTSTYNDPNTTT